MAFKAMQDEIADLKREIEDLKRLVKKSVE